MRSRARWGLMAVATAAERTAVKPCVQLGSSYTGRRAPTTCQGVQRSPAALMPRGPSRRGRPAAALLAGSPAGAPSPARRPRATRPWRANGADWSTASKTWCRANSRAALRVAQVVLVDGRFDLVALADHRAPDEQAREEVAGEVHEQRARTGRDHAVLVDFDHQADPAMDVLVGDVLRQPRVAREEVGLQVVTSGAGGPGPRKDARQSTVPADAPCALRCCGRTPRASAGARSAGPRLRSRRRTVGCERCIRGLDDAVSPAGQRGHGPPASAHGCLGAFASLGRPNGRTSEATSE